MMNMVSISTESSEYAVVSDASSPRCCRRYVRMQTVIGGKLAPVAAAKANTHGLDARNETAASNAASEAGNSRAPLISMVRGPCRSITRPIAGATQASPAT